MDSQNRTTGDAEDEVSCCNLPQLETRTALAPQNRLCKRTQERWEDEKHPIARVPLQDR